MSRLASVVWPWVVPLLAAAVALFLMVRDRLAEGPVVVVRLPENPGLVAGESPVRWLGVRMGTVEETRVTEPRGPVELVVQLEADGDVLARPGTRYWVVQPELGWGRVRGLDALRGGPYLGALPGPEPESPSSRDNGALRPDPDPIRIFDGSMSPPPQALAADGQPFEVYGDEGMQIREGGPVYYRGVEVGHLSTIDVAPNGHDVVFELFIERRYIPLVRAKTIFWPVTGLKADVGLFGADIQAGTLESFFGGGIAFATPAESPPVDRKTTFRLSEDAPDDWEDWSPSIGIGPP